MMHDYDLYNKKFINREQNNYKYDDGICSCCGSAYVVSYNHLEKMWGIIVSPTTTKIHKRKFNEKKDVVDVVETKNGPIQVHVRTKW